MSEQKNTKAAQTQYTHLQNIVTIQKVQNLQMLLGLKKEKKKDGE